MKVFKMAATSLFITVFMTFGVVTVDAGWCWNTDTKWFTTWCDHGCCGDYNSECCPDDDSEAGKIVGIVIGSLCGVALIVGTIVAVICIFQRTRGQTGSVLTSANQPPVTNINMPQYPLQPVVQPTVTHTYQYSVPQSQTVVSSGYM